MSKLIFKIKVAILLGSLYILTIQHVHGLHYPQYFQTFNLSDCIGPSSDFLGTTANMTLLPGLRSAKSASGRGIWRVELGSLQYYLTFSHRVKFCSSLPQSDTTPLTAAIQLVVGDLDDSILSLYTEEYYKGRQRTVSTNITTFGGNFVARSWAFTGPKGFTLYSGDNFTGNSTCLEPDSLTKAKGWGANAVSESNGITARSAAIADGRDGRSTKIISGSSKTKNYAINSQTGEKFGGVIKNIDRVIEY